MQPHQGSASLSSHSECSLSSIMECPTWQHWNIRALCKLSSSVLAAEHAHGLCSGAQEGNALALQRLHKVHILAEEAVSGMACLAPACMGEALELFPRSAELTCTVNRSWRQEVSAGQAPQDSRPETPAMGEHWCLVGPHPVDRAASSSLVMLVYSRVDDPRQTFS